MAGSRSGGRNAGIHCGVEVTELSTNKQHSLTHTATCVSARFLYWVLYVGVRASERESACVLLKVIVISATGHGVCARTCNSEGSSFGTIATALGQAEAGSGEEKTAGVRRACTRKEICRLPAGVQARRVPDRSLAGPKSSARPIGGPRGVRQYPIKYACLRQYPIEQDFRGCDAHGCVQHPGATAHACCD